MPDIKAENVKTFHDKINSPKRATATDGGFEKATAKPLVKSAPQIYGTMDRGITRTDEISAVLKIAKI